MPMAITGTAINKLTQNDMGVYPEDIEEVSYWGNVAKDELLQKMKYFNLPVNIAGLPYQHIPGSISVPLPAAHHFSRG
jgi:hypothetical protein